MNKARLGKLPLVRIFACFAALIGAAKFIVKPFS